MTGIKKDKKTSRSSAVSRFGGFALIIAGFALIFLLSKFLEGHRVELPESYRDTDLALQGKRLKGFVLGFEGLVADWYWAESLQYLGDKIVNSKSEVVNVEDLRSLNPRLLYQYLDNATDLDPKFMAAYSFGAIVLPAIDSEQAIKMAEKGIANNPEQWRLYQYLGYIYWRLKEFEKASEVYDEGSRIAGAPSFMRLMAASMKTQGGSRETARSIYSQMLAEADDEQTKQTAEMHLLRLDALDEIDAVNSALEAFKEKRGRCPQTFEEIVPMLRTVKLSQGKSFHIDNAGNLTDSSGVPYVLDEQTCRANLNPESKIPQF